MKTMTVTTIACLLITGMLNAQKESPYYFKAGPTLGFIEYDYYHILPGFQCEYRVWSNVGIAADFGLAEFNETYSGETWKYKTAMYSLSATYFHGPFFLENLEIFLKAGVNYSDVESSCSLKEGTEIQKVHPIYNTACIMHFQCGMNYRIGKHVHAKFGFGYPVLYKLGLNFAI